MTAANFGFFLFGLALLVGGAELLVRGASRLAAAFGVSPLVIGLTVVAYGTSAPELAVSVQAAGAGQAGVALGNVIGSNIFNVLFILGVSAAIAPLVIHHRLVRRDVWIMLGTGGLVAALGLDGSVSRLDGALLVAGAVAYTVWCIRQGWRDTVEEGVADLGGSTWSPTSGGHRLRNLFLVAAGLVMLVQGADWLVDSAVALAQVLGVSDLIIGLTVVAAGTSLPEVATSIVASLRGQRDIAVGNVVGSNIFNILAVLGSAAAASPGGLAVPEAALRFDIPVMLAVSVACVPIFFTGYRIDRWEGFLFLGYYAAYTLYLVLEATRHSALELYRVAMLWFVLPLTAVTLLVLVTRSLKRRGPA